MMVMKFRTYVAYFSRSEAGQTDDDRHDNYFIRLLQLQCVSLISSITIVGRSLYYISGYSQRQHPWVGTRFGY